MKRFGVLFGLVAIMLVVAACELPISYSDQPLLGAGGAAGWTMVSGTITAGGSVDMEGSIAGTSIMFSVSPLQVGEVRLQLNLLDLASAKTVTYYDGTTNYIMTEGAYEITAITSTTVSGRMNIWDDNNSFNGTFVLTIVP